MLRRNQAWGWQWFPPAPKDIIFKSVPICEIKLSQFGVGGVEENMQDTGKIT